MSIRSFYTGPRRATGRRTVPIRVPQSPERPFKVNQRDLVRRNLLRQEPWWLVIHRRGPYRPRVGVSDLEFRAVSREEVTGTLPERIVYKYLRDVVKISFDFQSSLLGGRLELGGLVADFILHFQRLILNPLGPTHNAYVQQRKDEEQRMTLAEMGFTTYYIQEQDIYNEYKFEEIMRGIFSLGPRFGSSAFSPHEVDDETSTLRLLDEARAVRGQVERISL